METSDYVTWNGGGPDSWVWQAAEADREDPRTAADFDRIVNETDRMGMGLRDLMERWGVIQRTMDEMSVVTRGPSSLRHLSDEITTFRGEAPR